MEWTDNRTENEKRLEATIAKMKSDNKDLALMFDSYFIHAKGRYFAHDEQAQEFIEALAKLEKNDE